DRVIQKGEAAEIQRHGKTVAEIRRKVGASHQQMLDLLKHVKFTKEESKELKKAMDRVAEILGYPNADLAEAYRQSSQEERDLDSKLGRASRRPSPGEIE